MSEAGVEARRVAIAALVRIERDDAYANLALPAALGASSLDDRDRRFVTELVYGATRMRRALDFVADRFIERPDVDPSTRAALRVGVHQLRFLATPPHAAVDSTVAATPKRSRGFVNAVLRKVSAEVESGREGIWPTEAIRLSYPDWLVDRLRAELGERADPILEAMNRPATTHVRDDGYVQDLASQEVVRLVGSPERTLDVCAAPGGKATGIAASGGLVIAADRHPQRARLVSQASAKTGHAVLPVVADGLHPPFSPAGAGFDAVLIDAPCSGLGSLRRRPDARWRIRPGDIEELAELQLGLIEASVSLLRPGGRLVYSVCTLTEAESIAVDGEIGRRRPELVPVRAPFEDPSAPASWEPFGRGGRLLPDRFDGDGMAAFVYTLDS